MVSRVKRALRNCYPGGPLPRALAGVSGCWCVDAALRKMGALIVSVNLDSFVLAVQVLRGVVKNQDG